jgi:hypothetical protein
MRRFQDAGSENLPPASLADSRLEAMTIDGIDVPDLLAVYRTMNANSR